MKRTLVCALLALTGVLPACAQSDEVAPGIACPEIDLEPTERHFCGTLDHDLIPYATAIAEQGATRLYISSLGGHAPSTMKAADILEEAGIEIAPLGVCASACAQFLFIPATHGELQPDTALALHHTSTSLALMRLRADWPEFDELNDLLTAAADEERAFYQRRGLDPALLIEPIRVMQPACVARTIDWTRPEAPSINHFSRRLWWAPRRNELEQFGMPPKPGAWLEDARALMRFGEVTKHYELGPIALVVPEPQRSTPDELANLPACEDTIEQQDEQTPTGADN